MGKKSNKSDYERSEDDQVVSMTSNEVATCLHWLAMLLEKRPELMPVTGDALLAAMYKLKSFGLWDDQTRTLQPKTIMIQGDR